MTWIDRLVRFFVEDEAVDEILVNGSENLVLIKGVRREIHESPFEDPSIMERAIQDLAFSLGLRADPLKPYVGGALSFGKFRLFLRWHSILRSACPDGPILSLRRHRFDSIGLMSFGEWSPPYRRSLDLAFEEDRPVIVMGPTGSGKTSMISAILYEYCSQERVVILEQYSEISRRSLLWVCLNSLEKERDGSGGLDFESLFSEVLRMRPDRIVLGEARGSSEGKALLNCLIAGQGGALSSIHCDDIEKGRLRLASMMGPEAGSILVERNPLYVMMARGNPPKILSMASEGDFLPFSN